MTNEDRWTIYFANTTAILLHPGAHLPATKAIQLAKQYADLMLEEHIATWPLTTEKNSSSHQARSSEASSARAPQSTETSQPQADNQQPTKPTGTSTNKT